MRAFVLAAVLFIGLVISGCAAKPKMEPLPPAPPPLTTESLSSLRANMQKVDARVRVGRVTAVRVGESLAAIEDMNLDGLHERDIVSLVAIVDGQETPIAGASVKHIEGKILVVKYTMLPGALRGPAVDDLAVIPGKK